MKILIAEDDNVSRMFLFKTLSQYGECDITKDGLETLEAYMLGIKDNNPYDLICLDIMMPKVNGIKVLKSIRDFERKKHVRKDKLVKIILITAFGQTQLIEDLLTPGLDIYLSKPYEIQDLLSITKELGFNID